MNEKVLLFGIADKEIISKIQLVMTIQKIGVKVVQPQDYSQSMGFLAGIPGFTQGLPYAGTETVGPMMVLCLAPSRLDKILAALRQAGLPPIPKAILTQTNAQWAAVDLYKELLREQEEIRKAKAQQ